MPVAIAVAADAGMSIVGMFLVNKQTAAKASTPPTTRAAPKTPYTHFSDLKNERIAHARVTRKHRHAVIRSPPSVFRASQETIEPQLPILVPTATHEATKAATENNTNKTLLSIFLLAILSACAKVYYNR